MLEKEVFSPIAASAATIKNLLADFVCKRISDGMVNILATMDIATKAPINHGKIFLMLKFAFNALSSKPLSFASLRLIPKLSSLCLAAKSAEIVDRAEQRIDVFIVRRVITVVGRSLKNGV